MDQGGGDMSGLEPSYENIIKQELEIAELKQAYHALMGQAVGFAETLVRLHDHWGATTFLVSPEVRTWREKERKK